MSDEKNGKITFYAAECMEFIHYGELRDNLTLADAVREYKKIYRKNASSGPGIGFVLEDRHMPDYSGIEYPIYEGGRLAKEQIELVPAFRDHPLVKQAVKAMEAYLPQLAKAERGRSGAER